MAGKTAHFGYKVISEAWPRSFIDKATWKQHKSGPRPGGKHRYLRYLKRCYRRKSPLGQDQTVKKRRGVETYKFFQNWLRVIFQWWGAFICTVHPARRLVEFGLKKFSTEITWEISKKILVRKSHGKFQKVKNLVKSKFEKARIWPNFSAISRKNSWVIFCQW